MTWLLYFTVAVALSVLAFVIGYALGRDRTIYVQPATPTIAELPRMDVATKWRREHWNNKEAS